MRLLSFNVNGIRAIEKKGFLDWLEKESPDILGLQETKAHPEQLNEKILKPDGYQSFWSAAEKKGYSGVALYTKTKPKSVEEGLGVKEFDSEGRTLIADYGDFILFNIYYPNGGAGNQRVPFKMKFYEAFLKKAESLRKKGKALIICGDVNTAHTEIDLARPQENEKNTGFLPEERAWVSKFIHCGYVDTFRHFVKGAGHYSWWDYKTGARVRDVGWRIDYFFVTKNLLPRLQKAFILKDVQGSDHCPVGIELK
ncbi:MAG: exodeoxyribonuclease III [Candidatus Omnitrophica bacterium]|nr:exodeoxyribonuclease III [Candidatus Omnitrophota bacterium]